MVSVSTWFRYIANKLDYSVSLSYKVPSLPPPFFFLAFSNDFISCFNECLWVFLFILCFDDFLPCIWFLGFGGSFACVNALTMLERFLFAWWVFCFVDLDQGFTGDGIFQCHFSFIFIMICTSLETKLCFLAIISFRCTCSMSFTYKQYLLWAWLFGAYEYVCGNNALTGKLNYDIVLQWRELCLIFVVKRKGP